jgi:hypothetical protein
MKTVFFSKKQLLWAGIFSIIIVLGASDILPILWTSLLLAIAGGYCLHAIGRTLMAIALILLIIGSCKKRVVSNDYMQPE